MNLLRLPSPPLDSKPGRRVGPRTCFLYPAVDAVDVSFLPNIAGITDVLWVVIAFLAGALARAGRLPPLVGYLAAGMGLSLLGVEESAVVDRIGEIGVALLLFLVGLDLRWKSMKRPEVVGAGSTHILLFAAIGTAGGLALGLPWYGAVSIAISLCTSSLVLAAQALDANGDRRSLHGRVVIGIILIQHVAATAAVAGAGAATPSLWALALLGLPLLQPLLHRILNRVARGELFLLFGLALAAAGSILFAGVNLGPELGALAAGALLAGHDRTEELRETLTPVKNALIPAFFLSVGLVGLPDVEGLAVVAVLLLGLSVKAALFFGTLVGFRMKPRAAWMTTLPLTTYSGLTLIVGSAAVSAGALPESALTVLALATAGSYLLNAPIARRASDLWEWVRPLLEGLGGSGAQNAGASTQRLDDTRYLVVGMGRTGTAAYDYLDDFLRCPVGLDDDPERVDLHEREGRRVLLGDPRDSAFWSNIDADGLDVVLLTTNELSIQLDSIRALRSAGYTGAINALTAHPEHRDVLHDAGANTVYLSVVRAGRALAAHGLRNQSDGVPSTVTLDVGLERTTG